MARIAFVCAPGDRLNPARRSSVAIVTANLARHVAAAGHEVTILAADASSASGDPDLSAIELVDVRPPSRPGTRLRELGWGYLELQPPFLVSKGYFTRRYLAGLTDALRTARPDVVQLPTFGQYLPELTAALPGVRIVLHLHDELWGHLPGPLIERQLGHAARIVCVNGYIRSMLAARAPGLRSRISVLHNGVDAKLFGSKRALAPSTPKVLYVGRVSPEKGLHVLAASLSHLHRRFPDLRAEAVGDPGLIPFSWLSAVARDDAHCQALLRYYGSNPISKLQRQLHDGGRRYVDDVFAATGPARSSLALRGFLPHKELPPVLNAATAMVCPSVCNEISMSAYEGMATGLPTVISYDLADDGPIADRQTALVVPRSDSTALAAALEKILADPALATSLGDAARQEVLSRYTWSNAADRLLAVYASIMQTPTTR